MSKIKEEKKEMVTIRNYQRLAMRTCLKSCMNKDYADAGLESEWHELLAKIWGLRAKKIRGDKNIEEKIAGIAEEIGDCFWFLALKCELVKYPFDIIYRDRTKQKFPSTMVESIKEYIEVLKGHCRQYHLQPIYCMKKNIEKLSQRKASNKIKGDGDGTRTER